MAPGPDEAEAHEASRRTTTLGWGGVRFLPDGRTELVPEPEALARAIPHWVAMPEHLDDAVAIYLGAVTRPEPVVRAAAVRAFGAIAARYERVPKHDAVRRAAEQARGDPDPDVRAAADEAVAALRRVLGS